MVGDLGRECAFFEVFYVRGLWLRIFVIQPPFVVGKVRRLKLVAIGRGFRHMFKLLILFHNVRAWEATALFLFSCTVS